MERQATAGKKAVTRSSGRPDRKGTRIRSLPFLQMLGYQFAGSGNKAGPSNVSFAKAAPAEGSGLCCRSARSGSGKPGLGQRAGQQKPVAPLLAHSAGLFQGAFT